MPDDASLAKLFREYGDEGAQPGVGLARSASLGRCSGACRVQSALGSALQSVP